MRRFASFFLLVAVLAACGNPAARRDYQHLYPPSAVETFATPGSRKLTAMIYRPKDWHAGAHLTAMVLFFGGGWRQGTPWSLAPFAWHFRSEGYVVFLPDYRVRNRDRSTILDSVRDARTMMRWLKAHAAEEGIDPARVVAGGASAGGHLAAALPVVRDFNNPSDDLRIDPTPSALLLFNPVANLDGNFLRDVRLYPWAYGVTPEEFLKADPTSRVGAHYPPCIVFHGTADTTVSFASVEKFVDAVKAHGGRCTLVPFPGRNHAFYDTNPGDAAEMLRRSDAFLNGLGYPEK